MRFRKLLIGIRTTIEEPHVCSLDRKYPNHNGSIYFKK